MKSTKATSAPTASLEDARVLLATAGVSRASLCEWGPDAHTRELFLTLVLDPEVRGAVHCCTALSGCDYVLRSSFAPESIPVRVELHDNGGTHIRLRVRSVDGQSIDRAGVTTVEIHHPALGAPRHVALLTTR